LNLKPTAIALGLALALIAGCGGTRAEFWGRAVPDDVTRAGIGDILADPLEYNGKVVVTEGTVTGECAEGCTFWLEDATGRIYVTTTEGRFAIPPLAGRKLRVFGHVTTRDGTPTIIALGATRAN